LIVLRGAGEKICGTVTLVPIQVWGESEESRPRVDLVFVAWLLRPSNIRAIQQAKNAFG
jgi:hypothetical protein